MRTRKDWSYRAIVSRRWKYIRYWNGTEELYRTGSAETRSLAGSKRRVVRTYARALRPLKRCHGSAC
ncbi:MAG: hypothetical protein R2731_06815 [Nocardioides sp.]